ncbi:MAG: hypothetical protein ABI639_07160 [Thermoanaerobaculia bacterium]
MPNAAVRLGELLESRGQITREQLLRALRNQKVLGGRLGTCLLEIEAVSEEDLASALGQQLGVPFATPEELRGIPDEVLELLPAKVAKRCRAIAFHASATQVKVALMDARDLGIQDEIAFVIGKRIRWHVSPELRILEALEKHFGEECPSRLAKLLDKMNRSRFLWARESAGSSAQTAAPAREQLLWEPRIAGVSAPPAAMDSSESIELPQFQHQTLDLPSVPLPSSSSAVAQPAPPAMAIRHPAAPMPPGAADPAIPPGSRKKVRVAEDTLALSAAPGHRLTVDEAEQRLVRPDQRDDVARALLDFAAGRVERAVLFVVRKEEIAAWLWAGPGIDAPRLAALRLRLQQPSVFVGVKLTGTIYRGKLAAMPAHLALADCFQPHAITGSVLAIPIKVKERLVAVLLLEPTIGSDVALAAAELADLRRVVAKAEIGFELCIMQSKLRKA